MKCDHRESLESKEDCYSGRQPTSPYVLVIGLQLLGRNRISANLVSFLQLGTISVGWVSDCFLCSVPLPAGGAIFSSCGIPMWACGQAARAGLASPPLPHRRPGS